MKVVWMPLANKQLRKIARYIRKEFGGNVKDKFLQDVQDVNDLIGDNPNVGKIEPLLDEYPEKFRSFVVNRRDKIIYYVVDQHVEVVAFWDCRQEPEKLAKLIIMQDNYQYISDREKTVLEYLEAHGIAFTNYTHPEGKTIEEAKRWWKDDGSVHCKNLFFRNHKGNKHYLVCFHCDHDMDIHDLEQRLKASLVAQGLPSCGKLSFASPERMMRYLGLEPGSVSPFGLINDAEHHVHLFLDENLRDVPSLSFHPNDCRGTVVIDNAEFKKYLECVGNTYEYIKLY